MITGLLQWFKPAPHKPRLPQAEVERLYPAYLINAHKTIGADGKTLYDFTTLGNFWVIASVFALVLPLLVWNAKHED